MGGGDHPDRLVVGVRRLILFRILVGVGEARVSGCHAFTSWLRCAKRRFAGSPQFRALAARSRRRSSRDRGARLARRLYTPSAASLAWTVVWIGSFRDRPDQHLWVTASELAEIRADGESADAARGPTPWRQIVSRMWLVTVVDFCYGWTLWVFLTWLPSYLTDARGFRLDQIALMTTLPLLGGVVGDTLGGVMSDAIYRRTGDLRLARRTLLVIGLGGAFAFILPAIITGSAIRAVSLLGAAFFFLELSSAVLWTLPLDIAGQHAGTAGGIMNTGFGVAGMISPVVFGVLIQRTGHYELPLFISAGLLLAGAFCAMGIDPTLTVAD